MTGANVSGLEALVVFTYTLLYVWTHYMYQKRDRPLNFVSFFQLHRICIRFYMNFGQIKLAGRQTFVANIDHACYKKLLKKWYKILALSNLKNIQIEDYNLGNVGEIKFSKIISRSKGSKS